MKKFIAFLFALFIFSGCTTDAFYRASKTVYIAGKKVVIQNWDELPDDVKEKLKKVDKAAKLYDSTRQVIKPAVEEAVKEVESGVK